MSHDASSLDALLAARRPLDQAKYDYVLARLPRVLALLCAFREDWALKGDPKPTPQTIAEWFGDAEAQLATQVDALLAELEGLVP